VQSLTSRFFFLQNLIQIKCSGSSFHSHPIRGLATTMVVVAEIMVVATRSASISVKDFCDYDVLVGWLMTSSSPLAHTHVYLKNRANTGRVQVLLRFVFKLIN